MAFILIEVVVALVVFYALCFPYLSSVGCWYRSGDTPLHFWGLLRRPRLRRLSQKKTTSSSLLGEEKNAAVFSKLDLCCGTKRKERSGKKSFALLWLRMQNKSTIYNSSSASASGGGYSSWYIQIHSTSLECFTLPSLAHNGEFIRLDPPSWAFASAFLSFFAALSCVELGSSF